MIGGTIDTKAAKRVLDKLGGIVRRPFDAGRGRLVARRVRQNVIRVEFLREGGFGPSGAFNRWKATKAFGNRPAPTKTLGGLTGKLGAAWMGGPGGFVRTGPNRVTIGVDLVFAEVQRGGRDLPSRRVTKIRVTKKIRGFLAARLGVFLRADTKFISIQGRPHVDPRAPQFAKAAGSVVLEAITKAAK